MRCRVGDLVVVVHSQCGNEGRIGTIVRRVRNGEDIHTAQGIYRVEQSDWLVAGRFRSQRIDTHQYVEVEVGTFPDGWLRPLRDSDGTDEVLHLVGHPLSASHREKVGA